MDARRIALGEIWKSEESGDVYIVMPFCRSFSPLMLACGTSSRWRLRVSEKSSRLTVERP